LLVLNVAAESWWNFLMPGRGFDVSNANVPYLLPGIVRIPKQEENLLLEIWRF
jgi:hypothetical protein